MNTPPHHTAPTHTIASTPRTTIPQHTTRPTNGLQPDKITRVIFSQPLSTLQSTQRPDPRLSSLLASSPFPCTVEHASGHASCPPRGCFVPLSMPTHVPCSQGSSAVPPMARSPRVAFWHIEKDLQIPQKRASHHVHVHSSSRLLRHALSLLPCVPASSAPSPPPDSCTRSATRFSYFYVPVHTLRPPSTCTASSALQPAAPLKLLQSRVLNLQELLGARHFIRLHTTRSPGHASDGGLLREYPSLPSGAF